MVQDVFCKVMYFCNVFCANRHRFALEGGARTGGYPTEVNRVTLDFWVAIASCGKLVGPCLSLHDAGRKDQQREVISVERHVKVIDGTV